MGRNQHPGEHRYRPLYRCGWAMRGRPEDDNWRVVDGKRQRRCRACGEWKSHKRGVFRRSERLTHGLETVCACCMQGKKRAGKRDEYWKDVGGIRWRMCKQCDTWKMHTAKLFVLDKATATGLTTICKQCRVDSIRARTPLTRHSQKSTKARWATTAGIGTQWELGGADRDTINLLHTLTAGWGRTEEGKLWLGR